MRSPNHVAAAIQAVASAKGSKDRPVAKVRDEAVKHAIKTMLALCDARDQRIADQAAEIARLRKALGKDRVKLLDERDAARARADAAVEGAAEEIERGEKWNLALDELSDAAKAQHAELSGLGARVLRYLGHERVLDESIEAYELRRHAEDVAAAEPVCRKLVDPD